jgi:hypothetical protein
MKERPKTKALQRGNEIKSWFIKKTNKIDKPLSNLTKNVEEKDPNLKQR